MIFDYYNIICSDCNKRLTNTREKLNYFKAYCSCRHQQNNNTEFSMLEKNISLYKSNKFIFSIHLVDIKFKNSIISINNKLVYAFGNLSVEKQKEMRDYYINKPYLSEVYNEFMKIIHTYETNLIFI